MTKYEVSTGCTICGMCIVVCPVKAITLGPKGAAINQNECTGCGTCCRNCASEAIHEVNQLKGEREQ